MMVDDGCKAAARVGGRECRVSVKDNGMEIARRQMRSSDRHRNAKRAVVSETVSVHADGQW